MINRIRTQSQKCPQQKFALGGHSQGGAVVTAGIPSIPKALLSKVVAVTMFGSPPCSDVPQVAGRCKSFCNKGDTVCAIYSICPVSLFLQFDRSVIAKAPWEMEDHE